MANGSFISENDIVLEVPHVDQQQPKTPEMILPGNLYGIKAKGVFRNEYDYPALSVVDEWVNCIAPLL